VINLADVPRDHVIVVRQHSSSFAYPTRSARGRKGLIAVVLGGDRTLTAALCATRGIARGDSRACAPSATRRMANPHADALPQVGYLATAIFTASSSSRRSSRTMTRRVADF
jgi:hypothetical protein